MNGKAQEVRLARRAFLLAVLLGWGAGTTLLPQPVRAADKKTEPYALIAGTVFRNPGFAMAGAEVTVKAAPSEVKPKKKIKTSKVMTNGRGEFAVRVPAGEQEFVVTAKAKGFATQEKSAKITGDERVDVYFVLDPEKPEQN